MQSLWKSSSSSGRPVTGHQSIRGKISGPIPIASPADDEFPMRNSGPAIAATTNDDEFPIRNLGSAIASMTPLPEESDSELLHQQPDLQQDQDQDQDQDQQQGQDQDQQQQDQQQEQQHEEQPSPPPAGAAAGARPTSRADVTQSGNTEPPSHPPPPPPSASPPARVRTPPHRHSPQKSSPPRNSPRRTNPSSTLRYSSVSEAPTGQTGRSKDGAPAPQRKKSTLRTALGKLFGRRKKAGGSQGSVSTFGRMSGMITTTQHRSDPSALDRLKEGEAKRSASLPITEYDRALRSHSIGPRDMTTIEGVRNSLQADISPSRTRAATTTSRLFTHPRRDFEWAGLTPRPASTHGRGSRLIPGVEDPSEIGRAITSDSGGGIRRRSRSLSGLHEIAAGGRPGQRRRSDEIRYWRESYEPGLLSPLSSNAPEEAEAENDDTGVVDSTAPGSPSTDRPPKTPPQPFNFGSLANEMVGMKITQAASLDSRIGGLETRMLKLERVVNQLCHSVPGFKTPLTETPRRGESTSVGITSDPSSFVYTTAAPPMIPAIYQTISNEVGTSSRYSSSRQSSETDGQSHLSFGDAPTFIGSLHPPSSSATQSQSLTATAPPAIISPANRPDSNSTVRGAASLPTMARYTGDESGGDDAPRLLQQLESERVARQALEAQVKKLSDRLNSLSTTMYALVRDPARSRSQEHLHPPASPLQQPRSVSGTHPNPVQKPLKALSIFETDEDSDAGKEGRQRGGDGDGDGEGDEDDLNEDFQTPRDEHPQPHYGAFGEELRDDDDEVDPTRKKAARTLSLSQLTLGKGAQLQI